MSRLTRGLLLGGVAYLALSLAGWRVAVIARHGTLASQAVERKYRRNLKFLLVTYDNDGNPTAYGTTTFGWNARNQLTSTSAGSASFAYDGLGRRSMRTVGGVTTKYLHAGLDVVQELNGSGQVTANLLTGLGIDEVFRRTEAAGSTTDFLTDRLGSTLALIDTAGAVQTSYTYEPFGKTTVSGTATTNGFKFTGRENNGATTLYFYRSRHLSPTFQRFVSEDPIGFGSGDLNLYSYVGNAPTNLIDPLGLERGERGCGLFGLRCAWRFFQEDPLRVINDAAGCVYGAMEAVVAAVPAEALAPRRLLPWRWVGAVLG